MNFKEKIKLISSTSQFKGSTPWWRDGELVAKANGRIWAGTEFERKIPKDLEALGCSGWTKAGRWDWLGWDLDVGHGKPNYTTLEEAVIDARRLRDALEGNLEIRISTNGNGLHCKTLLPAGLNLSKKDGPRVAKRIACNLGILADRSALGRQHFWLWKKNPHPKAFQLIEGIQNDNRFGNPACGNEGCRQRQR